MVFITITAPPWTAARGEGGMSMDGHSTRNYGSTKKRAGVPGGFTIEHPRPRSVQTKPPRCKARYDSPQFAKGHSLRLSRLSALRLVPGRCSLGSATRTVVRTPNPNDPPQFAKGHSLRLPRLSALRLVTGRCSLASATRTVHWTVRVSGPPIIEIQTMRLSGASVFITN